MVLEKYGANLHEVNDDGIGLRQKGRWCPPIIYDICRRNNVQMTYGKKTIRTLPQGQSLSRQLSHLARAEDTHRQQSREGVQPRAYETYPWDKCADSMEAKHNAEQYHSWDKHYCSEVWTQYDSSRYGQYTNTSSVERKRHTDGVQPRPVDFDRRPAATRDRDPWSDYKPGSWNQTECW